MNATLPVVPTPIPAMTDLVFAVTLALLLMAPLAIAGVEMCIRDRLQGIIFPQPVRPEPFKLKAVPFKLAHFLSSWPFT